MRDPYVAATFAGDPASKVQTDRGELAALLGRAQDISINAAGLAGLAGEVRSKLLGAVPSKSDGVATVTPAQPEQSSLVSELTRVLNSIDRSLSRVHGDIIAIDQSLYGAS